MIVVAVGIIGATVMPHNLYLHTALVQTRKLQKDEVSVRRAIRFNTIDTAVALSIAFVINAAILVLAAIVFYGKDSFTVAGGQVVSFTAAPTSGRPSPLPTRLSCASSTTSAPTPTQLRAAATASGSCSTTSTS